MYGAFLELFFLLLLQKTAACCGLVLREVRVNSIVAINNVLILDIKRQI